MPVHGVKPLTILLILNHIAAQKGTITITAAV